MTIHKTLGTILLSLTVCGTLSRAQVRLGETQLATPPQLERSYWRGLAVSLTVQAAASGFDAWTSWQRPERNTLLAQGGRFTADSAGRKAGLLGGVAVVEVLLVKKWGNRHPWIVRACQIGNFTTAGVLFGAGARNLGAR